MKNSCVTTALPSDRRARTFDSVRPFGTIMLTIVLLATPVLADTCVLTLDEQTIPAGIQCGETWNEAGLDLTVLPTDPKTCFGLSNCIFTPDGDRLWLFPGMLNVDLDGIAGTVNSAVVIAGSSFGICSMVSLFNGTAVVDSTIGACASLDTLEVVASGMPVDRLALEACYQSSVYEIRIDFDPTMTGIGQTVHAPAAPFARPNPFDATTRISFELETGGRIQLRIYDVSGRTVRSLVDAELPAGRRTVAWDGRDTSGRRLASGTYFARLAVNGRIVTSRRVVIAR